MCACLLYSYGISLRNYIGAITTSSVAFGQGSDPTLLDYVRCSGSEHRLFDCEHNGIEIESCDHTKDAGVVCMQGNTCIKLL